MSDNHQRSQVLTKSYCWHLLTILENVHFPQIKHLTWSNILTNVPSSNALHQNRLFPEAKPWIRSWSKLEKGKKEINLVTHGQGSWHRLEPVGVCLRKSCLAFISAAISPFIKHCVIRGSISSSAFRLWHVFFIFECCIMLHFVWVTILSLTPKIALVD